MVEVSAFEEAKATVESMIKAGKDEGACADLASATIKEVEDAVDSQQKALDSLDTGADCTSKNQEEVDAAQGNLDQANKDKTDADAAAAAAAGADVTFSPKPLSSLTPGQCGTFFTDPAYTSAQAAAEAAKTAATQAAGAVTAAEAGLKAAQEAQQEAIAECKCSAKKAYEAAWEAANANNDANEKAYTKGKHMKCVLAGTPPASCSVGDIPKVTAITLADGVESASCSEHPSNCLATADSNKFACISNKKTGNNNYVGTATMTEQTCTEKGLKFTYGKNDNHLLTIDIVKALYKAASGQTCTTHAGQSGGCGWGEIMQPHKDNTCNTPHDCKTGNWMKGDAYPAVSGTNTGTWAGKYVMSICSQ